MPCLSISILNSVFFNEIKDNVKQKISPFNNAEI